MGLDILPAIADSSPAEEKEELRRRLRRVIEPMSLASERVVQLPEVFESLFPSPGLQRGRLVGVSGNGGWSLGFALAGSAAGAKGWVAMLDVGNEGLMAAQELGVSLDRLLVIRSVPQKEWASVVAALAEVVDAVVVNPVRPLRVGDVRRLRARLQEQQSLLISLDGGRFWPEKLDVSLHASKHDWHGLGNGFGHLQGRSFEVTATGRRSLAGHQRSVAVRRTSGPFICVRKSEHCQSGHCQSSDRKPENRKSDASKPGDHEPGRVPDAYKFVEQGLSA